MPYWEMVQRSFKISWRYKYLWLLALFSGELGGAFNFNSGISQPGQGRGGVGQAPDFKASSQPYFDWITNHVALIVAASLLLVLLWIAFFVLAAVCEGAVVRASAEHDAERPFALGIAWRCGRATMGTIIRLRLLLIALALPVVILVAAVVAGFVFALLGKNGAAAAGLGLLTALVILASIPYAIYLYFLDRLGTRAVVLEQMNAATAALARGNRLVRKRFGRVLVVWLVAIATGFVVGICVVIASAIVILPVIVIGVATYASGGPVFFLLVVIAVVILLPILLAATGFLAAQASTYWTLAFRRLEIDRAPAYAYPAPPQPIAPPATP